MLMHYYYHAGTDALVRAAERPEGYEEVSHTQAATLASLKGNGWFCMPIHRDDVNALAGIGWEQFCWEPTAQQRHRATVIFGGQTLEQVADRGGCRWEELWAVLTDNPWRRLVVMRAFTMCRDWPKSLV